jgi:hypothetical protein
MNEIYGVDPDAPKDLQELRSLFERFGPSNGRFIGRFPDDWLQNLERRFSHLSGLDRSRLTILVQRHQDTLLDINAPYSRTKEWGENAKNTRLFQKALSKSPNSQSLPTLEEFLWDDSEADSSRGGFLPMTVDAYCNACAPLLAISSETHLADRFFQLRRDSGELNRSGISLLRGLLQKLDSYSKKRSLFIHFELPRYISEDRYEERLQGDLESLQNETNVGILYDIHEQMNHGRYIFSIKGGLQFDHGFLIDRTKENHVHWLSSGELRPILASFRLAL